MSNNQKEELEKLLAQWAPLPTSQANAIWPQTAGSMTSGTRETADGQPGAGSRALGIAAEVTQYATQGVGGLSPFVSMLMGLFGGKDEEHRVETPKFALPDPRNYDLALVRSSDDIRGVSRTASGALRADAPAAPVSAPSVVVNVSAIDSRSFLDHSASIADAVREALLSSHGLHDVLREE